MCLFGKVKLQGDETLARAVFEIFENVLIARIIRHHEQKTLGGFNNFAELVDGQQTPMIRQRMNDYRGVFARLDDFVEITDAADFHGAGQRAVDPCGAVGVEQIAADQIARG